MYRSQAVADQRGGALPGFGERRIAAISDYLSLRWASPKPQGGTNDRVGSI
jgi:hypothetical protein